MRVGAALLILALLLGACSSLPEYARPTGEVGPGDQVDVSNLITYRTLTPADFQASEPPAHVAAHRQQLAAATCGMVRPSEDSKIIVMGAGDGYLAIIPHLRFEAFMRRDCSWWNPDFEGHPEDYVLQHEQIHFAFYELGARSLNARAAELSEELRSRGETTQEALAEINRKFVRLNEKALRDVLERSRSFDEDTSMSHNPVQQAAWARRIDAELAASAP